jgi:hypothetical protein
MSYLRQLVAGFSSRRIAHLQFVVSRVALGLVFLQTLPSFPVKFHSASAQYTLSTGAGTTGPYEQFYQGLRPNSK